MTQTQQSLLEKIVAEGVKLTPMMQQYYDIKKQFPDELLMFRMGDFYELFFEDAQNSARILNISLTHRGKLGGHPIPMAGIPHHAAATYIDRITSQGMKVAICEQVEDPKMTKGIVKRAVTQVVSPGMPYDLDKATQTENNYMGCAFKSKDSLYLILIDYTTGDFVGLDLDNEQELIEKLKLFNPKELISYLGQWDYHKELTQYIEASDILKTHLSEDYFVEKFTSIYIEKLIPAYKKDEIIKLHKDILSPIGALSYYICSTQSVETINHFRPLQLISGQEDMKITYPTLVGLEIFPKSKEQYKNSLLGFMDKTRTSMGTREIKVFFQNPIRNLEKIIERQKAIAFLIESDLIEEIRENLSDIRDIERIMAKVTTGKVNGSDLLNLACAEKKYAEILKLVKSKLNPIISPIAKKSFQELTSLCDEIRGTINDEIGATLDKGNLIKAGANKKRDKLAKLSLNAADSLVELESKYRQETGISNLKIKSNNVAGYFIEVSKSHTKKVPKTFERRQTLVNSERYQTPELEAFEKEVISAKDKLYRLEREIFDALVTQVIDQAATILAMAKSIALIDIFQSISFVCDQNNFIAPTIQAEKQLMHIQGAWHPLIKEAIKDQFVTHDLSLDSSCFFGLITGPNMAGKTTVMREMAIIQFLGQLGCYVPASVANIGICDYIFSRLGAHDDIIRGQSTFMVEMSETAEILRHATNKSLIILDEIGRGTSTYDGLSIAWALVEYFVTKTCALTLFSTHYHELIDLVEGLDKAKNLTVKTKNENGNVQFLYKLIEAGAAQSFGIHVAKLAGLPRQILKRSDKILNQLEAEKGQESHIILNGQDSNQLNMFAEYQPVAEEESSAFDDELREEIKSIDVMNMTPIQALQKLHELQGTVQ